MQPTLSHQRWLQSLHSHGSQWRVSMCGRVLTSGETVLGRTFKVSPSFSLQSKQHNRNVPMCKSELSTCLLRRSAETEARRWMWWKSVDAQANTYTLNGLYILQFSLLCHSIHHFQRAFPLSYSLAAFWLSLFASFSRIEKKWKTT